MPTLSHQNRKRSKKRRLVPKSDAGYKPRTANQKLLRWYRRIATIVLILFFPILCVIVSKLDAFSNPGAAPHANIVEPDVSYTGLFYHARSGLYFAEHRAYDSGLKRWMNRDPEGEAADQNLYRYANGDPVRYRDPSGYDAWVPNSASNSAQADQTTNSGQSNGNSDPGVPNTNPLNQGNRNDNQGMTSGDDSPSRNDNQGTTSGDNTPSRNDNNGTLSPDRNGTCPNGQKLPPKPTPHH